MLCFLQNCKFGEKKNINNKIVNLILVDNILTWVSLGHLDGGDTIFPVLYKLTVIFHIVSFIYQLSYTMCA